MGAKKAERARIAAEAKERERIRREEEAKYRHDMQAISKVLDGQHIDNGYWTSDT